MKSSIQHHPSTVHIIRHGCKLDYQNHGPSLTPKGFGLSFNFPQYFVSKILPSLNSGEPKRLISEYKKGLDVIYVTNPSDSGKSDKSKSFREIQTVSPLISLLYAVSADNTVIKAPLVQDPYAESDYKKLIDNYIFTKDNDKANILICWNHRNIPDLVHQIATYKGFSIDKSSELKGEIAKWESKNFTTIIKLEFSNNNNKVNITKDGPSDTFGFTTSNTSEYIEAFQKYLTLYQLNSPSANC